MKQEYGHLHEIGVQVSKGFADGITADERKRQERKIKEIFEAKRQQIEQLPKDTRTDKERQEDEAFARLKELFGKESEDTE